MNRDNDQPASKPIRQRKSSSKPEKDTDAALAALGSQIGAKEDSDLGPKTASRNLEEELRARIDELEKCVRENEAFLADRCIEPDAVKSDAAVIEALQNQLREKENLLRAKDATIGDLEQSLGARMQNLASQFNAQQALLASREAQLDALTASLDAQTEELLRNRRMNERISTDTARLISEQREAKLALAKVEIEEWHAIGRRNAWKRPFRMLRRLFGKMLGGRDDRKVKDQLPKPS